MNSSDKKGKAKNSKQKYDILNLHSKGRQNKKLKIYTKNKTINPVVLFDYKVLNKNYIHINENKNRPRHPIVRVFKNNNKGNKIEKGKASTNNYDLIQIDSKNIGNKKPPNSDILLDNFEYETAIKYDKREFWKIFYICMLNKENIINIFLFKTPLDILSLRICLFIFTYSCDLAFNTIFYSNDNISDRYHYEGENLLLFSLVNNLIISAISYITELLLVNAFQHLIDSRGNYENVFRKEENKMRKLKNYKVSQKTKIIISNKIIHISKVLIWKTVVFIFFEFSMMLFFYYFVTAFCEVYKKTQISWLADFFSSFLISLLTEFGISLLLTVLYITSINYKIRFIYNITIFFYNL
jgi:hypothetical protein